MTTVLVTGANRGLGLEFVRQYARADAHVIACCRNPDSAASLHTIREKHADRVRLLPLDISDPKSIEAVKRKLGDCAVDILINNAGVSGPDPQTANEIDYDSWLYTFRVNSMGPLVLAQALFKNLRDSNEKKLVSISSGLGSTSENSGGGWYGYRASKAALNNAMHGLSRDWAGDGILVVVLSPGWVQTDMGGRSAPLTAQTSVEGMRKVIAELSRRKSGKFLDYRGREQPW